MALDQVRFMLAAGALALAASCASQGEELESVPQAAHAACEAQHVAEGSAMDACVEQMSENIRAARQYQPEPPPRAAPHNSGGQSRSSSPPSYH